MTKNFLTISLGPQIARAIRVVTSNGTGAVVATLAEGVVVGCHFVVCHCWVPCWGACCVPLLGDTLGCHGGAIHGCHGGMLLLKAQQLAYGLCCGVCVRFLFKSYQHALALTLA